ncbi:hypothetical protein [Roseomonas sp. CECT 9278]|uniref:hypothetical protein n=1 Tax=Roseomonas sp. CECT 9278 TaxID=2845823 RepID=UPI001E2A0432|nr:hypothetical protein [Roseomonas sp. CECT 9278]
MTGAPPFTPPPPIPGRRGPGRPRGSKNRTTVAREQALAAAMGAVEFGEVSDSLALLRAVMRSPAVPLAERLRCALALAPFDAPKVAPQQPTKEPDANLAQRLNDAFRRCGRGGASAAPAGLTAEQQAELEALLR